MHDPESIRSLLEHQLDLVVDGGVCDGGATTIVDLAVDPPAIVRMGRGDIAALGLVLEE